VLVAEKVVLMPVEGDGTNVDTVCNPRVLIRATIARGERSFSQLQI
jgi:hypothetical protein